VHGVGGATGTVLVAFLAGVGTGGTGLAEGVTPSAQAMVQITGVVTVGIWSAVATIAIVFATKAIVGLRVSEEEETDGLDFSHHGESAYKL
ncbi:MAG: hypothetical protein AAFN43_02875, partial [Pseudomonadota bacterium]